MNDEIKILGVAPQNETESATLRLLQHVFEKIKPLKEELSAASTRSHWPKIAQLEIEIETLAVTANALRKVFAVGRGGDELGPFGPGLEELDNYISEHRIGCEPEGHNYERLGRLLTNNPK